MRLVVRDSALAIEGRGVLVPSSAMAFRSATGEMLTFGGPAIGVRFGFEWAYSDRDVQRFEPVAAQEPTVGDLAELAGRYTSRDAEVSYDVRVEDGALIIRERFGATIALTPTYEDAFESEGRRFRLMREGGRAVRAERGGRASAGHALQKGVTAMRFGPQRIGVRALLIALGLCLGTAQASHAQRAPYDLLIRNGRIVDGSGSPWFRGDVAIRDGRIAAMGPTLEGPAARVVDVQGQVVAPGFIDLHTHARRGIYDFPTAENYLRQGVTTILEGPDGSSPLPFDEFLDGLAALPLAINIGAFIGQGSVRAEVVGEDDRAATPAELSRMKQIVEEGMRAGAFGMSTGLFYVPGTFTPTAEVVELARVAGRFGGIHISHMREEASQVVQSVLETIEIGERGELPTQVTHHKVIGAANYGRSIETLRLVDEARRRGVDVTLDQYPYTASSTNIQSALFPAWAEEGGRNRVLSRLADAPTRARVKSEVSRIIREERGGGDPTNVVLARCEWDPSLDGKNLADVARLRGMEPTVENAAEVTLWIVEQGNCSGVFHAINEEDLERILKHPATMVASDGEVTRFGEAMPHPRSYGTFARVLSRYVRERGVIGLEDAVRKMSAYPAQRIGLHDRGVLRTGLVADVIVFDPERVRDLATFEAPHQYAEGFSLVLVNGEIVLEEGELTGARPGSLLRGPGYTER